MYIYIYIYISRHWQAAWVLTERVLATVLDIPALWVMVIRANHTCLEKYMHQRVGSKYNIYISLHSLVPWFMCSFHLAFDPTRWCTSFSRHL